MLFYKLKIWQIVIKCNFGGVGSILSVTGHHILGTKVTRVFNLLNHKCQSEQLVTFVHHIILL